ncbi:protein kinase domain-containing protein [Streptomyces sp. NBC_00046]|uniref:protein kinase domain-containing protein n=1 Tax=unclassified Streptomyces TaxID=2593676 RepID=UPI003866F7CF
MFEPGPSLAEVIVAEGALPTGAVRALGARLADALVAVHGAGLVHRDVKPANVLLALDGPRLIDFGIARHEGATALTEPDALIGTPGYLAPEQASGERAGPACDVFALGCVLAYTATGRRPFGDGGAASVLFRTVHEPPDLHGLPPALLPLVEACLAKDPAARPTARDVARALAEGPDEDPRAWAPPGLAALIAARSAAALDVPVPDLPTVIEEPSAPRPARRTVLTAGAASVLLAGGAVAPGRRRGGPAPGRPPRTLPTHTIGLHADLTGPGRATGLAYQRGMRLAVDDHNARADAPFRLALRTEGDAGDPARALRAADRLAADPKVLAVVGPTGGVVAAFVVERYSIVAGPRPSGRGAEANWSRSARPGGRRSWRTARPRGRLGDHGLLPGRPAQGHEGDRAPGRGGHRRLRPGGPRGGRRRRGRRRPRLDVTHPGRPLRGRPGRRRVSPAAACPPATSWRPPSSAVPGRPPGDGCSPRRTATRPGSRPRRRSPPRTASASAPHPPAGPPRRTTRSG